MIEKVISFKASDGSLCSSIEDAQRREIAVLAKDIPTHSDGEMPYDVASFIVANKEHILDILTTKASSKPRARWAAKAVKVSA